MFAAFKAAEEWGFQLQSSTDNGLQNTGGLALIEDVQLWPRLHDDLAEDPIEIAVPYYGNSGNIAFELPVLNPRK